MAMEQLEGAKDPFQGSCGCIGQSSICNTKSILDWRVRQIRVQHVGRPYSAERLQKICGRTICRFISFCCNIVLQQKTAVSQLKLLPSPSIEQCEGRKSTANDNIFVRPLRAFGKSLSPGSAKCAGVFEEDWTSSVNALSNEHEAERRFLYVRSLLSYILGMVIIICASRRDTVRPSRGP